MKFQFLVGDSDAKRTFLKSKLSERFARSAKLQGALPQMDADKTRVLFISTYPTRTCEIANFTQDIVCELKKSSTTHPGVVAISGAEHSEYDSDVFFDFRQNSRFSHLAAADTINNSVADLVMVEHEFGIYGGEYGEYLLDLLERLEVPYMITCHSVPENPADEQQTILSEICYNALGVVVMSELAKRLLWEVYDVPVEKTEVFPHGFPDIEAGARERMKEEFGCEGRTVVCTFGQLGPGKGLEHGIEAIAEVAGKHEEILYLVFGQTHPLIQSQSGEKYREGLKWLADGLGIGDKVEFLDRYLDKGDIMRCLAMADICLAPGLEEDAALTSTLACAMGAGRVVVCTPSLYAQEMLSNGRGLLAEFGDAHAMAAAISLLIENLDEKTRMEKNTLRLGRTMTWNKVAKQYEHAFRRALQNSEREEMFLDF